MPPSEASESYAPAQPRFVRDLDTLIRARYPLLYLVSWGEQRIEAILQDLASQHGKTLFSWSIARGLRRLGGSQALPRSTCRRRRWKSSPPSASSDSPPSSC